MAIDWQRPEYTAEVERWKLVDDMCDERNLSRHIPDLDVLKDEATVDGRRTRNTAFKERASFLGASRITLQGLIGVAFERDPQITLPAGLEYLLMNADGSGVDLYQQMQAAVGQALRKGRFGLFVSFPQTDGPVSVAEQESLAKIATIDLIDARRVINWWTKTEGAETFLAGVVFTGVRETVENYEVKAKEICRELALDENGDFFDRTWIRDGDRFVPEDAIYPTRGDGQRWKRIPFLFCGAERNTWATQTPPLLSLARKNRDHLRNSAINEEGIWFSGHIQPVADEMSPEAVDVLTKDGFVIGGGSLLIAKGFRFEVAEPNNAARQGMLDKAQEMAALGARLVEPGSAPKTAQQDAGERKAQHSILSLICVNVEDAYQWAVEQCAAYMNVAGEIAVKINRAFMEPSVSVEKMRDLREALLAGVIGPKEMYIALQRAGDIDPEKTLEEYEDEVSERGLLTNADAGTSD